MPLDSAIALFTEPNQSLLKNLEPMQQSCEEWIQDFDGLMTSTEDTCVIRQPRGDNTFKLFGKPNGAIDESERERRLELALWRQWGPAADLGHPQPPFLAGVIRHIQSIQVPLGNVKPDPQKAIDLVSVSEAGLPVVMELKAEKGEGPLWMLAEAFGYALALRKNWNDKDGCLRAEWA